MIRIAVDAMGGDFAPESAVKGVNLAIAAFDNIEVLLFGDQDKIRPYLEATERVEIIHTPVGFSMTHDNQALNVSE